MAPSATHVFVFLFGVVSLATHITLVGCVSPKEGIKIDCLRVNPQDSGADSDDHSLQTRGLWDNVDLSSLFDSVISNANRAVAEEEEVDGDESAEEETESINSGSQNSFNNFGTGKQNFRGSVINTGGTTDSFNHDGHGDQDFSGAVIDSGNIGSDGITIGDSSSGSTGSSIKIGNISFGNSSMKINGIIIRVLNSGNRGVSMIDNKVYIGNKLICSDMSKTTAKPTHQKTPDGTRWFTNLQVGQPMSQAEVEQFDKDWAEHERQHKERMDALNARLKREATEREKYQRELQARLKREAEERASQHKEQMDALHARLKREAEEREKYQRELQARLKREAEERARQQKELFDRLKREQEDRERQQRERMDALHRRLKRQAEDMARQESWRTRSPQSFSWW